MAESFPPAAPFGRAPCRAASRLSSLRERSLDEVVRTIRQFLERIDSLLAGQFFFRVVKREPNKFDGAFLVRLQLRFVRLKIFRDVVVADVDVLLKILVAETDHGDVE